MRLIFQFNFFLQNHTSGHITDNVDAGCAHIAESVNADVNAHNTGWQTGHGCQAAKDAMAPPGIPGVPTDRSTFARRIMIIMEMLTLIPHALAKNMIMNDIRMDTASMFTVAPRGMAILVILLDTPISSSIRCLLIGMVAELEQVPNAFRAAGSIALKNFTGLSLPMNFTEPP